MYNGCISISTLTQPIDAALSQQIIVRWAQDSDHIAAAKLSSKEQAIRFLIGRSLIHHVIVHATGLRNTDYEIHADANGKPAIHLASGKSETAISLSRSNGMIAAGVTTMGPLGIDLEFHRQNRSFDGIASFAFGTSEAQIACRSRQDFYRIWCLREAMSKATGLGLQEATDRIDKVSQSKNDETFQIKVEEQKWLLAHITPQRNYSLAVAIQHIGSESSIDWNKTAIDLRLTSAADLII
jgi:4'-phosphopantetheinyl transferase